MPKQKTHRGVRKRFKLSKKGRIFHHMSNYFHKNTKKRSKATRQARQCKELEGGQTRVIRKMIGK